MSFNNYFWAIPASPPTNNSLDNPNPVGHRPVGSFPVSAGPNVLWFQSENFFSNLIHTINTRRIQGKSAILAAAVQVTHMKFVSRFTTFITKVVVPHMKTVIKQPTGFLLVTALSFVQKTVKPIKTFMVTVQSSLAKSEGKIFTFPLTIQAFIKNTIGKFISFVINVLALITIFHQQIFTQSSIFPVNVIFQETKQIRTAISFKLIALLQNINRVTKTFLVLITLLSQKAIRSSKILSTTIIVLSTLLKSMGKLNSFLISAKLSLTNRISKTFVYIITILIQAVKQQQKILTFLIVASSSIIKTLNKTFIQIIQIKVLTNASKAFLRTFIEVLSVQTLLTKQLQKIAIFFVTVKNLLIRSFNFTKTFVGTIVFSLLKSLSKTALTARIIVAATVNAVKVYLRTYTHVVSITNITQKALSVARKFIPIIAASTTHSLATTKSFKALITSSIAKTTRKLSTYLISLIVKITANQSLKLSMIASVSILFSLIKRINKFISFVSTIIFQSPLIQAVTLKSYKVTVAPILTISKSLKKILSVSIATVVTFSRNLTKSFVYRLLTLANLQLQKRRTFFASIQILMKWSFLRVTIRTYTHLVSNKVLLSSRSLQKSLQATIAIVLSLFKRNTRLLLQTISVGQSKVLSIRKSFKSNIILSGYLIRQGLKQVTAKINLSTLKLPLSIKKIMVFSIRYQILYKKAITKQFIQFRILTQSLIKKTKTSVFNAVVKGVAQLGRIPHKIVLGTVNFTTSLNKLIKKPIKSYIQIIISRTDTVYKNIIFRIKPLLTVLRHGIFPAAITYFYSAVASISVKVKIHQFIHESFKVIGNFGKKSSSIVATKFKETSQFINGLFNKRIN